MRLAIVSYDLKDIQSGDNRRVKEALESHVNCSTTLEGINLLNQIPQWVHLPNTTVLFSISNSSATAQSISEEVTEIIRTEGATPNKVFVGFVNMSDYYLWNAA